MARSPQRGPRLAHQAPDAFVIHRHPAVVQFGRDPPPAVAPPGLPEDLLDGGAPRPLLFGRRLLRQVPVIAGATHRNQLTHPFHRYFALRPLAPRVDFDVDASAPEVVLFRRCPSTLRKAAAKKSASSALCPQASFNNRFSRGERHQSENLDDGEKMSYNSDSGIHC